MVSGNPSHKNQELARYRLTGMQGNAMLLGLMSRRGAYWNFTALGTPAHGSTIVDIIKDPATSAIVSRSPSQAPGIRKITLRVVKGRNLVAKDRGGLFSRKNASSDPFVKVCITPLVFVNYVIAGETGICVSSLCNSKSDPSVYLGRV